MNKKNINALRDFLDNYEIKEYSAEEINGLKKILNNEQNLTFIQKVFTPEQVILIVKMVISYFTSP
jgi:hypothetical protein